MGIIDIKKTIFWFMCFILVGSGREAWGVNIQSVSGELTNGGTLIIQGNLFGKRGDYGGEDSYLPYLWETFDEANPYIDNPKITGGYAELKSAENKKNSRFYLKHHRSDIEVSYTTFWGQNVTLTTMYNCRIPVQGLSPESEYFFSGWFMTRNIDTLTDNVANQLKTLDASPASNNYKIYFNLEGYAGYPRYSMDVESYEKLYAGPTSTFAPDGTWHRFDIYISVPTSNNSYTDVVKFWIDGKLTGVSKQVGHLYQTVNDVQPIDGIYYVNWINNSSKSPFYILTDDAYIDFTQARVEISESPVWDDTVQVHKELQIPLVWNDGEIQIKVNQGSMTSLSDKFLFVIDKNGVVSNSFALSNLGVQNPAKVQGFQIQ